MLDDLRKLLEKDMSVGAADALASINGLTDAPPAERPAVEGAKDLQDLKDYIIEIPCMNCGAVSNIWGLRFQEFVDSKDSFPCPSCNSPMQISNYANGLDSLKQAIPESFVVVLEDQTPIEEKLANRLMKGLDKFPSREDMEYEQRVMAAKSMEDEAKIREVYGDPSTRDHEKEFILREWERIKKDQESGLNDDDVWANHLDRVSQIANAMNNGKQAIIRAAHFELEGLTTAASMFRERAAQLGYKSESPIKKSFSMMSRYAIGGSWLRKAKEENSGDEEEKKDEEYEELMDDFILDMIDQDLDMEDIDYYANLIGATMKSMDSNTLEKSWKWQRKDGSWWMTNPEGGKPIPYRPNQTFQHFQEGVKAQEAINTAAGKVHAWDPNESYNKLPEDAQKRVQKIMDSFKGGKKSLDSVLEKAHARIQRVNYLRVGDFTEELKNNPAFKEQNALVGKLAAIGKNYMARAIHGSHTDTQKKFWAAIAHVMSEDAMHEAKKRNLINTPFFTTGEGSAPDMRSGVDVFVGHQAARWMQQDKDSGKYTEQQVMERASKRAQNIAEQMNSPLKALSRSQEYEALGMQDQATMFYALYQELNAMSPEERKARYLKYLGKKKEAKEALKQAVLARKLEREKKKGTKAKVSNPKKEPKEKKPKKEKPVAKEPEKAKEPLNASKEISNILAGSKKLDTFDLTDLYAIRHALIDKVKTLGDQKYKDLFEDITDEIKRQNKLQRGK